MKIVTTVVIILLLIAQSCIKDTGHPLPPETHTGAYTFGCKVDGKVYEASGKPEFEDFVSAGNISYSSSSGDSTIYISAVNRFTSDFDFDIRMPFPASTGTYSLKGGHYSANFTDNNIRDATGYAISYKTSDVDTGSITITYFDGTYTPFFGGNILAGTFWMNAVSDDGKVIHITDGRFDIGN